MSDEVQESGVIKINLRNLQCGALVFAGIFVGVPLALVIVAGYGYVIFCLLMALRFSDPVAFVSSAFGTIIAAFIPAILIVFRLVVGNWPWEG